MASSSKIAQTNLRRYGPNFYRDIGSIGGSRSRGGGFWHMKYVLGDVDKISRAGKVGGARGRRGKKVLTETPQPNTFEHDVMVLRDQLKQGGMSYHRYLKKLRDLETKHGA